MPRPWLSKLLAFCLAATPAAAQEFYPSAGPLLVGKGSIIKTLTLTATATSTGSTITAPATVNPKGLFILVDYAIDSAAGDPGDVIPTGFTGVTSNFVTRFRVRISYRITDGTEDSAVYTGMDGDATDDKVLLYFEGDQPITD